MLRLRHRTQRHSLSLFVVFVFAFLVWPAMAAAQGQPTAAAGLTQAEKEEFLRTAEIVKQWNLAVGVTNSRRATLQKGDLTHDAHIQTVNIAKGSFQTQRGTELNFRDSYKYNVAAYELSKILGIDMMVPPSVERKVGGTSAAVTWWVDDKMMDELDRVRKNMQPPNLDSWNKQMYVVRLFDQLIYNTDRNLGNLVITNDWNIHMIDHTRGFRMMKNIENSKSLVQCDRQLLARLRELKKDELKQKLNQYLTGVEIDGLLARAQKIAKFFDDEIKSKGEAAVLYDLASARK